MSKKLEEFLKKTKPKNKSKLAPFEKDILDLQRADISLKNIKIYLSEQGVKTSPQNISQYLKRINNEQTQTIEIKKPEVENKETIKAEKKKVDYDALERIQNTIKNGTTKEHPLLKIAKKG